MEKCCKNCKLLDSLCSVICPFPEVGCSEFVSKPKRYVLVHHYLETGHSSIIAFSDSMKELVELKLDQPFINSLRHLYSVVDNNSGTAKYIKDKNLSNICKNVAEYLSIGEYAMLKKSFNKASSWFEKAKNSAFLGADILDNY